MTDRMEVSEATVRALADPAGLPSLAVPRDFDAEDPLVGIRVLSRPFDEADLFRVSVTCQRATDFREQASPLLRGA